MTVESAWPSNLPNYAYWTDRDLVRLADADSKIRTVLKSYPTGKIAARLEIASQNLAEAAALIEKGE